MHVTCYPPGRVKSGRASFVPQRGAGRALLVTSLSLALHFRLLSQWGLSGLQDVRVLCEGRGRVLAVSFSFGCPDGGQGDQWGALLEHPSSLWSRRPHLQRSPCQAKHSQICPVTGRAAHSRGAFSLAQGSPRTCPHSRESDSLKLPKRGADSRARTTRHRDLRTVSPSTPPAISEEEIINSWVPPGSAHSGHCYCPPTDSPPTTVVLRLQRVQLPTAG